MSEGGRTIQSFWDESSRAETLEAYRTLVDTIDDAIYQLDPDGRFVAVNDGFLDLLGYSRADLLGEPLSWVLDAADAERVQRAIEQQRQTPDVDVPEFDLWFETASGDEVPCELRVNVLESDGAYQGSLGVVSDHQDQRKSERERELEQYETITESLDEGVYVVDADRNFQWVNEAYAEMLEYAPEELIGENASMIVDDEVIRRAEVVEAEHGPEALPRIDIELQTKTGDRVPVEVASTVLPDGDEDGWYRAGVVRDITQRKERARALEESERRYRALVENFPDGAVGLFNEDFEYTAVGGELLDGLDVDPADRVGHSIDEIHDAELVEKLEPHFRAALNGETSSFEVEYRGKHLAAHTLPVGTSDEISRGMLVVQDFTEQREMEEDLRESEARFKMLAENLDEIVWMMDPGGDEFRYVNPAYEDVWGRDRDELYEDPTAFLDYVHPEDQARVREAFAALPGEPFDEEFRIVRPDGEVGWVHAHGKRVHDPDIELERVIGIGQDITDRKEREYELERALDLLERTERVADVGGWEIDTETMDVFWTDYTFELLGVESDEEPPLDEALDMYHDDDQPVVENAVEEALSTGDPFDIEARVHTNHGDVRWLRLQGVPEVADGEVVTLRGAAQNITERKERERALEESERRYRTLAEHFPNGAVGVYDHDLRYSLTAGEHLGGVLPSSDELEGSRMPDIFPEHTVADLEPMFRAAVESGETGSTMTEFGGRHWQVWATPLRNADGEITAGLSFAQDVTERVEREQTLEMRAHQQSVVAELGKYALEVDDPDELMAEASKRVAEVLDNDYCEVLDLDDEERRLVLRQGVGWRDGIVGSATVDTDDNSQAGYTLLSKEPVVVEDLESDTRFSGPDLLTSHDVTSGISTIIGSFDDPWGILGAHDTDRRSYTDEDVAFVQTVANILAESIERHRYNAELKRTVEKLEASNERLEQFAYAASHDLQEPLRMVSSYLSLIERRYGDVLDEDGQEFIEFAVEGAERMRDMIDALLEYSRVDTRGDPFEPVDLNALMESVLADYQMKIEETDATITTTDLPTVYGDENQLRQLFGNLVSNALEYSGDDPPTVRVFAEREGDRWAVGVEDDGIGIDPEHVDRVFEVFQRLHTQEEYGGTGIGLALAERIVERHGGDIWVESEPGEGSTFYCSLPVVDENQ